jgi:signal transduction histidine kinase
VATESGAGSIEQTLRRRVEELELHNAVHQAIAECGSIEALLPRVLRVLAGLRELRLQAKAGVFLVEDGALRLAAIDGDFTPEFVAAEAKVPFGSCLCGRVALSGELLVSASSDHDHRHEHRFPGMIEHGHYVVPLKAGSAVVGVLFLYTDPHEVCEPARAAVLAALGGTLGLAIARLRDEAALRAARDAALAASRERSRFLASVSHELRTPLNAIIGYAELLAEEEGLGGEGREIAERLTRASMHLGGVINDFLDFSKIEAGGLALESRSLSPAGLVAEVLEMLAPTAQTKGIWLRCEARASAPKAVLGDPIRLRQVLVNLVSNAVKFTQLGGVAVIVDADGERLVFAVHDTGIGIAAESLERLFSPFAQADASISRRFGGTGLGLMISKMLVDAMGGQIEVRSTVGVGSTFVVSLPSPSLLTLDQDGRGHLPVLVGR